MYADEATLYSSNINFYNLYNDLDRLDFWLKCDYLTLNYKKIIIFSHKNIPDNIIFLLMALKL